MKDLGQGSQESAEGRREDINRAAGQRMSEPTEGGASSGRIEELRQMAPAGGPGPGRERPQAACSRSDSRRAGGQGPGPGPEQGPGTRGRVRVRAQGQGPKAGRPELRASVRGQVRASGISAHCRAARRPAPRPARRTRPGGEARAATRIPWGHRSRSERPAANQSHLKGQTEDVSAAGPRIRGKAAAIEAR